jgi:hypothetical protein
LQGKHANPCRQKPYIIDADSDGNSGLVVDWKYASMSASDACRCWPSGHTAASSGGAKQGEQATPPFSGLCWPHAHGVQAAWPGVLV